MLVQHRINIKNPAQNENQMTSSCILYHLQNQFFKLYEAIIWIPAETLIKILIIQTISAFSIPRVSRHPFAKTGAGTSAGSSMPLL